MFLYWRFYNVFEKQLKPFRPRFRNIGSFGVDPILLKPLKLKDSTRLVATYHIFQYLPKLRHITYVIIPNIPQ